MDQGQAEDTTAKPEPETQTKQRNVRISGNFTSSDIFIGICVFLSSIPLKLLQESSCNGSSHFPSLFFTINDGVWLAYIKGNYSPVYQNSHLFQNLLRSGIIRIEEEESTRGGERWT